MPAPQTITINLTQAETNLIWQIAQEKYPNATGQQVLNKLADVGKSAIRDFVINHIRQERENAMWAEQLAADSTFQFIEQATPATP